MMLKEGKGAAFTTTPSSGILAPFSGELIEVAAYCDMWGEYQDRILCKVSTGILPPFLVGLREMATYSSGRNCSELVSVY